MSSNSDGREKRKYSYFAMTDIDQELLAHFCSVQGMKIETFVMEATFQILRQLSLRRLSIRS